MLDSIFKNVLNKGKHNNRKLTKARRRHIQIVKLSGNKTKIIRHILPQ